MTSTTLGLAALLSLAQAPGQSEPEPPTDAPAADEIRMELRADPAGPEVDELAARARSLSPVVVADRISLVGHVERVSDGELVLVGRPVTTELADIVGGGRPQLVAGSLVRVRGTGLADGRVLAETVELVPGRDPSQWSKLNRELREFQEKFWNKAERYDDPELDRYLAATVERLLPDYVTGPERDFEVVVVRNPQLNAFALPDGNLVLYTGIIARMNNEAQLAGVLAHEMAHVTQRHTLRAMAKSKQRKVIGWGSMLAALALGVAGKGDAARGVELMSSAWLSGYSRAHEDEADRVGLRYMYLAGYDVREAAKVWRTFQLLYGPQSQEATFFYGSHSTPRDREHNLSQEVWKAYEPSGLVGGDVGTARFLAATAAMVRDNALLDLERGNLSWAEWGLMKSLAVAPDDPETHVALARLTVERGGRDALATAADQLEHALALAPEHPATHRELGRVYHRLGRPERARLSLERYLELDPDAADAEQIRSLLRRI